MKLLHQFLAQRDDVDGEMKPLHWFPLTCLRKRVMGKQSLYISFLAPFRVRDGKWSLYIHQFSSSCRVRWGNEASTPVF
jgi:hypothetical protein